MSIFSNLFGGKSNKPQAIPVLPADIYDAAALELRDIIAPAAIEIASGYIKIGDKIAKTYFTMSYPKFLTEGWLAPIINLDKIFDVSIHIAPINSAEIMKEFQKKVAEVQSQITANEKKGSTSTTTGCSWATLMVWTGRPSLTCFSRSTLGSVLLGRWRSSMARQPFVRT